MHVVGDRRADEMVVRPAGVREDAARWAGLQQGEQLTADGDDPRQPFRMPIRRSAVTNSCAMCKELGPASRSWGFNPGMRECACDEGHISVGQSQLRARGEKRARLGGWGQVPSSRLSRCRLPGIGATADR